MDDLDDLVAAKVEPVKKKAGTVEIFGKDYKTVALRVMEFRNDHPDWTIKTEILQEDADSVRMQTTVISDRNRVVSTGMAHETIKGNRINASGSMLENCETSSVGRALSFAGYVGEEMSIASAEEMESAAEEQKFYDDNKWLLRHNEVWRDNYESVTWVKNAIFDNDLFKAVEGFVEMGHDVQTALHVAPTKGGCWTKEEKAYLRSSEFNKAVKEYMNAGK